MSELTPVHEAAQTPQTSRTDRVREAGPEIVLALVVSVVLAVIAALVWWKVTPLAAYTRTASNGSMDEQQLAKQIDADGWFFVVTAVGGLAWGVGMSLWRRRDPILTVVLIALGGLLAAFVTTRLGLWLGPPDPGTVLATAKEGARVPLQLEYGAKGLLAIWPIAGLLGAIGVLWGTERADGAREPRPD